MAPPLCYKTTTPVMGLAGSQAALPENRQNVHWLVSVNPKCIELCLRPASDESRLSHTCRLVCLPTYMAASAAINMLSFVVPSSG